MEKTFNEEIQKYLNTVAAEMTFAEARKEAQLEILSHIEEHIETGMSYGLSQQEAIKDSLRRMGDPKLIGKSLNQIHKPTFNFILPLLALALSIIGLWNLSGTKWIAVQTVWIGMGLFTLASVYFLPVKMFKAFVSSLYGIAAISILVTYFYGAMADGQPYLSFFGVNIRIVDMAGFLFALGFAGLSSRFNNFRHKALLLGGLFLAPMAYFSLNGYIWPGLLFGVSAMCCLGMQSISTSSFVGLGILSSGMLASRFTEALVPIHEVNKAIIENAHTDTALRSMSDAVAAEVLIGVLFVVLLTYGSRVAFAIKDKDLRSFAIAGITLTLVQIFTSVLANLGMFPMISAGINIPFISYGGSGIVSNFLIIGILVACHKRKCLISAGT